FIWQLPLHRVGQIHMAGHKDRGDVIIDTHEGPIIDPVWDLYRFAMEEIGRPVSTLIEWDTNIPPLAKVVAEATHAQGIIESLGLASHLPFSILREKGSGNEGEDDLLEPARSPLAQRREAVGV